VAQAGTPSWLAITSSTTITVSSGSTLGASSSTPFRVWVVAFNDSGTVRLGVINCLTSTGITPLYEPAPASSTAEGGAGGADNSGVIYTGTAVTTKSFRILGFLEYTTGLAVAGTWNVVPDILALAGPTTKKPGDKIQTQLTQSGALQTVTSSTISLNDTVPTSSQGTQIYSLSITPTSKSNYLVVQAMINAGISATPTAQGAVVAALFQDSGASAVCAQAVEFRAPDGNGVNQIIAINLYYAALANTTNATTFKIRLASPFTQTISVNGSTSARLFGGVNLSSVRITELMA